jgi:uncharacterized protein (TIGR02246 family)
MKFILMLFMGTLVSFAGLGQTSRDTQAIKKVILLFQEDFNEGSFKNAAAYTTSDWQHINPLGGIDKGRDKVLREVRSVHQTFLKGVSITTEHMNIRFVTPDVAVVDALHTITNYTTPDGVKHEGERHIKTYVVVKKNEKWLLAHDHNTIILSPGTAAGKQ